MFNLVEIQLFAIANWPKINKLDYKKLINYKVYETLPSKVYISTSFFVCNNALHSSFSKAILTKLHIFVCLGWGGGSITKRARKILTLKT